MRYRAILILILQCLTIPSLQAKTLFLLMKYDTDRRHQIMSTKVTEKNYPTAHYHSINQNHLQINFYDQENKLAYTYQGPGLDEPAVDGQPAKSAYTTKGSYILRFRYHKELMHRIEIKHIMQETDQQELQLSDTQVVLDQILPLDN
jgi:hypothetical protein